MIWFISNFSQATLGLLIIRSSLDIFSEQQIPAIFALGLDVLALAFITKKIIARQKVEIDWFWCFFSGWIILQCLWLVLQAVGGLGNSGLLLSDSLREWMRLFSWLVIYLLILQLKGRINAENIISTLFISLIAPLAAASLQMLVPPSFLPSFLVFESGEYAPVEAGSRMNGTLGHPGTFATFLVLFLALTLWKLETAQKRIPWIVLAGLIIFFLVSSKSLTGLVMLFVLILCYLAQRASLIKLIGGIALISLVIILFLSSDLGQDRFQSLYGTPLLNPDIDWSRAILLSRYDGNSFNWRIAQWNFLLKAWQDRPWLGYGIGSASWLTSYNKLAHNDYIRYLVEEGIVGFLLFLMFFGVQFSRLVQLINASGVGTKQRNLCLMLINFLIAVMVGMMTDSIWTHTTLFFYWWTILAISGWEWNISTNSDLKRPKYTL
jgi:O-antigen ligase